MASWADKLFNNKPDKAPAPAGSSSRPSSSKGPATPKIGTPKVATPKVATPKVATPKVATPKVATPKVATPVAGPPVKAVTKQSQPTAGSYSILPQHQAAIDASNQAVKAATGSSHSPSLQGPQQTTGGQQGLGHMASTGSASTSGPGRASSGAWGRKPPRIQPAVPYPKGKAPGPPARAPAAPLVIRTAPAPAPASTAGSCPRCGTLVSPGGQGHAPNALLCDRDPRVNPANTLWPGVAVPLKQAREDEWLQDLFNEYCWRGTTIITPPALILAPGANSLVLTAADITARDSRLTFATKLPLRLHEQTVALAGGQLQREDCHEIRTAFNASSGANPNVLTNHLRISSVPDEFWKYDVQFYPALPANTSAKKKRVLLETMINRIAFLCENGPRQPAGTHNPVLFTHDNHGTIFATTDLYPIASATFALEDHVTLTLAPHTNTWSAQTFIPSARSGPASGNGVIGIGLQGQRGPANVDLRPFRQMVSGDVLYQHHHVSNIAQALNTLVAESARVPKPLPQFDTFQIGANKFFLRSQHRPLNNTTVLQLHDGFSVTVKPAMGDALLNFNSATSAFYCPLNVAAYLHQVTNPIRSKPERGLQGLRVYINYLRGRPVPFGSPQLDINQQERRIKTIFAIGGPLGNSIGTQTFTPSASSGLTGLTSVFNYLTQCYPHLQNTHPYWANSWVINVGSATRPEYYAAEHLDILPFQPWKGLLPGNLPAGMVTIAARSPESNKELIVDRGLGALGVTRGAVSTIVNPNFQIEGKLLSVPVRYIPAPVIRYSVGHLAQGNINNGSWRRPGGHLHRRSNLNRVVLLYRNGYNPAMLTSLRAQLGTSLGQAPAITWVNIPFTLGPVAGQPEFLAAIKDGCGDNVPNFIVFINPWANDKVPYDTFRRVTDIDLGIPSICIQEQKLNNTIGKAFGVLSGLVSGNALKVNSRFGNGINQSITFALPGTASMDNTIILGADVAHPGQSSVGAGSIAAMVGTIDNTGLSYGGSARPNFPRRECIDDFDEMLQERLDAWRKRGAHTTWPQNVLYFRDGVSESQYSEIRRSEVDRIRDLYTANGQTIVPNIMAVVVTKRHNTRFYPTAGGRNQNTGNTPPGTCVESEVTHPYYNDFFLQSHAAIKGTAKPAHYFVLQDDLHFTPNGLQTFIHHLCHSYQRSTTSVSYATPAYYADRLCDRVRRYFAGWYDKSYPHPPFPTEAAGFAQFRLEWCRGVHQGHHGNPWRERLDDRMFWL